MAQKPYVLSCEEFSYNTNSLPPTRKFKKYFTECAKEARKTLEEDIEKYLNGDYSGKEDYTLITKDVCFEESDYVKYKYNLSLVYAKRLQQIVKEVNRLVSEYEGTRKESTRSRELMKKIVSERLKLQQMKSALKYSLNKPTPNYVDENALYISGRKEFDIDCCDKVCITENLIKQIAKLNAKLSKTTNEQIANYYRVQITDLTEILKEFNVSCYDFELVSKDCPMDVEAVKRALEDYKRNDLSEGYMKKLEDALQNVFRDGKLWGQVKPKINGTLENVSRLKLSDDTDAILKTQINYWITLAKVEQQPRDVVVKAANLPTELHLVQNRVVQIEDRRLIYIDAPSASDPITYSCSKCQPRRGFFIVKSTHKSGILYTYVSSHIINAKVTVSKQYAQFVSSGTNTSVGVLGTERPAYTLMSDRKASINVGFEWDENEVEKSPSEIHTGITCVQEVPTLHTLCKAYNCYILTPKPGSRLYQSLNISVDDSLDTDMAKVNIGGKRYWVSIHDVICGTVVPSGKHDTYFGGCSIVLRPDNTIGIVETTSKCACGVSGGVASY